jgi:serine protease Do
MIRSAGEMMATRVRVGASLGLGLRNEVQSNRDDTGLVRQAVVERVDANGPAGKAGLQRGDVLVRVGEQAVVTSLDLERGLLDHGPGDKVAVLVKRNGAEQKLEMTLEYGRAAALPPPNVDVVWRKLGVRLLPAVTDDVTRTHPQLHGGMVVVEVRADGPAGRAGLQRGDILVGLHQWEMLTTENILFVLNNADLPKFNPLKFYVLRGGEVKTGSVALGE